MNAVYLLLSMLQGYWREKSKKWENNRMYKANNQPYIKIFDIETSNNKLVAKLDFSEDISKYFTTDCFVAEYDKNIEGVDESILVIPPLSNVVTVAWATGADIYVKNLDKS